MSTNPAGGGPAGPLPRSPRQTTRQGDGTGIHRYQVSRRLFVQAEASWGLMDIRVPEPAPAQHGAAPANGSTARQRIPTSGHAGAVTAMIGMFGPALERMARVADTLSISGIWMSISTRSQSRDRASLTALVPLSPPPPTGRPRSRARSPLLMDRVVFLQQNAPTRVQTP